MLDDPRDASRSLPPPKHVECKLKTRRYGSESQSVFDTTESAETPFSASHLQDPSTATTLSALIKRLPITSLREIDPEIENIILQECDVWLEDVLRLACQFAVHRKSTQLDVPDLALAVEALASKNLSCNPASYTFGISGTTTHEQRRRLVELGRSKLQRYRDAQLTRHTEMALLHKNQAQRPLSVQKDH